MTDMNLDEYYKDPLFESFTYVSIGMDRLRDCDPASYVQIEKKQAALTHETEEMIEAIRRISDNIWLPRIEADRYIEQFLQKFPLGVRSSIVWDDSNFIFLYIFTKMLKPKVIIETGCNIGFSSTFIALAVKENNNGCRFYTMDLADRLGLGWEDISFIKLKKQQVNFERLKTLPPPQALFMVPSDLREYIIFFKGSSKDILPDILRKNSEVDIFFHDSEHSYRNIIWESMTVLPYIRAGGYLLIHDVALNSAFKKLFHNAGIILGDNLGIFKKIDMQGIAIKELSSPADNSRLNDEEFGKKKIKLDSFPKTVIIQTKTYCNLNCITCPLDKKEEISCIDSDDFLLKFAQMLDNKITPCLSQAEMIILKLCDNFIQLPNWRFIIRKLQESFPEADRLFYIHGEYLTTAMSDLLLCPWGLYSYNTKNIIQVVLPASNSHIYKVLTGSDDYQKVFDQVGYLVNKSLDRDRTKVHFVFPVNTLNIEDLPTFVRLSKELSADKVVCFYNNIYRPSQQYLSCFFAKSLTNRIFNEVKEIAEQLNLKIELPPRFGSGDDGHFSSGICREPWSTIKFDCRGNVLPCDILQECRENFIDKDFCEVWNSSYFQNLRKRFIRGNNLCLRYCIKANPSSVNNFSAHVISKF